MSNPEWVLPDVFFACPAVEGARRLSRRSVPQRLTAEIGYFLAKVAERPEASNVIFKERVHCFFRRRYRRRHMGPVKVPRERTDEISSAPHYPTART